MSPRERAAQSAYDLLTAQERTAALLASLALLTSGCAQAAVALPPGPDGCVVIQPDPTTTARRPR